MLQNLFNLYGKLKTKQKEIFIGFNMNKKKEVKGFMNNKVFQIFITIFKTYKNAKY